MFDAIGLTQTLVSFDTRSSNSNMDLISFLAEALEGMGFSVQLYPKIFPAERESDGAASRLSERERRMRTTLTDALGGFGFEPKVSRRQSAEVVKANLVARIGPKDAEPFMLCGHTDVMPPGDLKDWKITKDGKKDQPINPFELVPGLDKGVDCLYGRGAVDMKGPLAAMICAAEAVVALAPKFKRELVFGLTHDEEVGLRGARRMAEEKVILPRYTLIAEPTKLVPMRMHKGHICLVALCSGQRAHAANPDKGKNAICVAAKVIAELQAFSEELRSVREDLIDPPFSTLNIGPIVGGSKFNEVPDACMVGFAIRPIPGQTTERVMEYIKQRLEALEPHGRKNEQFIRVELLDKLRPPTESMCAPADSELVKALEQVSGRGARGVCFSTDASVLQWLGTDCVIFGPGDIDVAHKPNERIAVDQLVRSVELYQRTIVKMCL